jgi:hypothetical protein
MAKIFEQHLKKCSTSTTVELPEHIGHVMLFDLYLKRKWDNYLSEVTLSDRTN